MYVVYLVTHVIMAICSLSIIRTGSDLPNQRVKREKRRAGVPLPKEDPAQKKPGFKKRILKNTSTLIKPKIDQKIFSQSPEFSYDMERLTNPGDS
ncbi:hypothetical protein ACPPVU_08420 [Mucilaginibacter sp. McL0603]|uniref:hypothetical protein n=1 Tax=Mucilaginibacter sp. McL0603 TaxID=3415670 RepID=UPI003CEED1EE